MDWMTIPPLWHRDASRHRLRMIFLSVRGICKNKLHKTTGTKRSNLRECNLFTGERYGQTCDNFACHLGVFRASMKCTGVVVSLCFVSVLGAVADALLAAFCYRTLPRQGAGSKLPLRFTLAIAGACCSVPVHLHRTAHSAMFRNIQPDRQTDRLTARL